MSSEEEWFQTVVGQLTPSFSDYAKATVKGSVEPSVKRSLKDSDKGEKKLPGIDFQFTSTDFGTVPPKIRNLRTHKVPEEDGRAKNVVVDFDVEYNGDCNLQVAIMGLPSGVRDLVVCGRARVLLKPTTSLSPPFFGGVQFCFLDELKIEFDLEGLADICDWSVIRRKVM